MSNLYINEDNTLSKSPTTLELYFEGEDVKIVLNGQPYSYLSKGAKLTVQSTKIHTLTFYYPITMFNFNIMDTIKTSKPKNTDVSEKELKTKEPERSKGHPVKNIMIEE